RRRLVGRAGYAERPLRDRVVGLEVIVRNRPVVGDSIERSETEILGVQPEGIALPVQRAPTHPARAFVAELVGNVSADRVAIQLAWRRLPRILVPDVALDVLGAASEVMAGTGLEHDHADAPSRQLGGEDAASRARTHNADLGVDGTLVVSSARIRRACTG